MENINAYITVIVLIITVLLAVYKLLPESTVENDPIAKGVELRIQRELNIPEGSHIRVSALRPSKLHSMRYVMYLTVPILEEEKRDPQEKGISVFYAQIPMEGISVQNCEPLMGKAQWMINHYPFTDRNDFIGAHHKH